MKTAKKTPAKVVVYKAPLSQEVWKQFDTIEDFEEWEKTEPKNVFADQVAVNDMILMGFDELYAFA